MQYSDPEFERWKEKAREITVEEAAHMAGFRPRAAVKKSIERCGPCPRCGGTDRFSIHTGKNVWNCRHCGRGGKDGIGVVMWCLNIDFIEACEMIAGPRPNPPAHETAEHRAARFAEHEAWLAQNEIDKADSAAKSEADEHAFRLKERRKAYGWWIQGRPIAGTPAETYLLARGLILPPRCNLRMAPSWTLYDGLEADGETPHVVHRGPALFAPIVGPDLHFLGLHITWFDPSRPGEKIMVPDEAGDLVPAKKIRGAKKGGHIVWSEPAWGWTRLAIAEGIENIGTICTALTKTQSPLLEGCAFWTSVDLGNLGGKALDRMTHPTHRKADKAGRMRRVVVPGIVPDVTSEAVSIPEHVTDLRLIGDGDSEPFFTRCVMTRAAARHARDGREIRVIMAPAGRDFNDVIRGKKSAHV